NRGGGAPAGGGNISADNADQAPPARGPRGPVTVQIDLDGLQQRIISVPGVPTAQYTELRSGGPGTVYYMESAGAGGGGRRGGGPGANDLYRYRLSDRREGLFMAGVTTYTVSADGHKLLYRAAGGGGGFGGRGAAAGGPPTPAKLLVDADRNPPQAGQGRLNFQLRMYLEPKEEFKQIFNEMWRNERDYLYVPNMHGTDWVKDKQMYGELLPYINHRADLNYLMDMMGAEIAIGHSYVRGGDMPSVPQDPGGLLGADFTIDNGRYKITKIYDEESWN